MGQIEVSVATDKLVYDLGESVWVSVTAHNPSAEAVTLVFGTSQQATYLMDGVFDWGEGKQFLQWITYVVIDPCDSYVWNLQHGTDEMETYALALGTHTVIGEVLDYGESLPVGFEVVPEPLTVLFLMGGITRIRHARRRVRPV